MGSDGDFPPYTGTLCELLIKRVALSGPFNLRGGFFPLELRSGTSTLGDRVHGTLYGIVSYAGHFDLDISKDYHPGICVPTKQGTQDG